MDGETINPKKATMVVGQRVVIGTGVGLSQIAFEKLDSQRGVSSDSFSAVQNLGPLAITAIGAIMTIVPKKQSYRTLGADLTSSGSVMLAYRGAKFATNTLNARKFRTMNRNGSYQRQGSRPNHSIMSNMSIF